MLAVENMSTKRLFDLTVSVLGLLILSPLLLIISLCILFDSGRPIIYRQERVGKDWKHFVLYKFRTMNFQMTEDDPACSPRNDRRISRVGRYLRKYKFDELPQLLNVLKGDMSFVGPRPELPKFVNYYSDDYKDILKIRPGITDLASIKFKDESLLLDKKPDEVEKFYISTVLPKKLEYNKEYLGEKGFFYDISLIFKTIYSMIFK